MLPTTAALYLTARPKIEDEVLDLDGVSGC